MEAILQVFSSLNAGLHTMRAAAQRALGYIDAHDQASSLERRVDGVLRIFRK